MDIKELLTLDVDLKKSSSVPLEFHLKKYLRYWPFFLAGIMTLCGAALAYIYYTPNQYEVTSSLMINSNGENRTELSSNAVLDDLDGYQISHVIENEVEVLTSISLIQKALEELSLYNTFYMEDGFYRQKEIYGKDVPVQILYHRLNDHPTPFNGLARLYIIDDKKFILEMEEGIKNQYLFGEKLNNFFGDFTIFLNEEYNSSHPKSLFFSYNDLRKMSFEYRDNINAEPTNKLSTVISLSLIETITEKGEQILAKLAEVYNTDALKKVNSTAANTLAFIDQQMVKLTSELMEIELEVENYKNKNSISDLSAEAQLYLENSSNAKQKLSEYDIGIEVLNNLEDNLTKNNNPSIMVQGSLLIEDTNLSDLIKKYNELQRERKRLLNGITPDSPLAKNLDEQLSSLKADLLENIQSNKSSIEIARKNLEANELKIENRVNQVPQIERKLLEITRKQTSKQKNYEYLMKKREESVLSLAATSVSNARIIDPPMAGLYPAKPLKKLIMAFALILGLGLPFGVIFLYEHFFGKIRQKNDLEAISQVPIMGEVSTIKNKSKYQTNFPYKSLLGEQISLIWTNMKFASRNQPNQVILTTSSIGCEGKTFFSINLAKIIALSGKKVVILEFDLRKPAVIQQMNLNVSKPGIYEYLTEDTYTTQDILRFYEDNANLFIIGAGKTPENPILTMSSPRLAELFHELRIKFDHIIIDSAPIGLVADAFALSSFTDMLVYMVRYYHTKPNHIDLINDIARKNKFKNPVLILNDAKAEHSYGYGYGYYYTKKATTI